MAIYEPAITSVSISPNPTKINTSFLVSVAATEIEAIMYAVSPISGAVKSGQSVILTTHKEVSS